MFLTRNWMGVLFQQAGFKLLDFRLARIIQLKILIGQQSITVRPKSHTSIG